MRYYKIVRDGVIISFGMGDGGEEITEEEYSAIEAALSNKPESSETVDYMLKNDLTWEAYEVEHVDPEIDEAEAFQILIGEVTG